MVVRGLFLLSLLVMVFLCSIPATVGAQVARRFGQVPKDSLLAPSLSNRKVLQFDRLIEDMGTLYESDTVRVIDFAFTNVSDTAVTVTKVSTYCGCTAAEFDEKSIPAGGHSKITVRYNPRGREGTVDTGAFVYTSLSGRRPVAKLTLRGNVVDDDEWSHLPYVAGDLKFKRKQVSFKNGRIVSRIPCANVGTRPMKLYSELLPEYATFATEPQVLQPGVEGDMVISIKPELLPGDTTGSLSFFIVISGAGGTPSSRTIKAVIE